MNLNGDHGKGNRSYGDDNKNTDATVLVIVFIADTDDNIINATIHQVAIF
jgi:hypothetical protein